MKNIVTSVIISALCWFYTVTPSYADGVSEYQTQTNQNVYSENEINRLTGRLLRGQYGSHNGTQQISLFGIENRPMGSGANGAENADIGQNISVIKHNYLTTSRQGEIDGLNVVVRQGGPAGNGSKTNSDAAGILIDVGILEGSGWAGALEASTSMFNAGGAVTRQLQTQIGVLDSTTQNYIGFAAIAGNGEIQDGIRLLSKGTGYFDNFLSFYNTGGTRVFSVDSSGRQTLCANSGPTPCKVIRALSGQLSILNDAKNTQIFVLDDNGNLNLSGAMAVAGSVTSSQLVATTGATKAAPGTIHYGSSVSASVGPAGGAQPLPATPLGYIIANIGGATVKIPYYPN